MIAFQIVYLKYSFLFTDSFKVPERPVSKPLRISVNDIYKGTGSGFCITGRVETGFVRSGDKVLVLPQNETALVKGKHINFYLFQLILFF